MVMNNEELPALPAGDKSKTGRIDKEKKSDTKGMEDKKLRPAEL